MAKRFTKKREDFACENCGAVVAGTGYTNHCPHCLWSKHVDVNPGDRAEVCGGLMKPVDIYLAGRDWLIVHQCQKCLAQRRKKVEPTDDVEAVIGLQKEVADHKAKK